MKETRTAIGTCHREAIDWCQDHFRLSRPVAEKTMFALIKKGTVLLEDNDFVLIDNDQETVRKIAATITNKPNNMKKAKTGVAKGANKYGLLRWVGTKPENRKAHMYNAVKSVLDEEDPRHPFHNYPHPQGTRRTRRRGLIPGD